MAVTFDPANKGANAVLSNGNSTVGTTTSFTWHQALSTNYHTTGKKYVEIDFTEITPDPYNMSVGFNDGTHSLTTYIGDNAGAIGYMSNARYYREGFLIASPTNWNVGNHTIMMAIDCDTGKVWFGVDGSWDGDPAAGTGEVTSSVLTGNIYVAAASYHTDGFLTGKFTTADQTYSAPTGFDAWEATVSSIDVSPSVNTQSLEVNQYESTVEIDIDILVNLLNKSLTQYDLNISTTVNPSVDVLKLTLVQPSASVISNINNSPNLNILEKQILIKAVTTDIINKLVFPITGGLDKQDGTSFKKGLDRVYNPNTIKSGLTKSYNLNSIIKGIEIVKR